MQKRVKSNQSEYVISADANILSDAINAIVTGEGVNWKPSGVQYHSIF